MSDAAAIESGLPEWRRSLNRFCENWIFAFVVAFAIRHFCLELFRIPSASMEPMLYGDPGLFKGDFVVVDKLTQRFDPIQRWDVAVFQYPVPEVESSRGERARPAVTADGDRIDNPLFRPLLGGNFVKRAVVLPGEEFYFQGGDLFLRDGGQGWTVARKPAALQEVLWLPVYRAGAQPGYRPWAGLPADGQPGDGIAADLAEGAALTFTQPLSNLYLKPGPVAVQPRESVDAWVRVDDVAMTRPQFAYGERSGSLWDLEAWQLKRLTSADEDDPTRKGRLLNELMTEWTGDLRVSFRVGQITGSPRLRLSNRAPGAAADSRAIDLVLAAGGWKVSAPGVAADGSQALAGKMVAFAQVDGQVVLTIDGSEVLRREIAWTDPNRERPGISWIGPGRVEVSALAIDRDLHWCSKGFLLENQLPIDLDGYVAKQRDQRTDAESLDAAASTLRLARTVRAELLGKAEGDLTRVEALRAYGSGPDNPARAPADGYLMLGDNSPLSLDGREWGFVPALNMRGRALLVIFPPTRWRVIR
jgi:signal peptidase I